MYELGHVILLKFNMFTTTFGTRIHFYTYLVDLEKRRTALMRSTTN